MTAPPVIHPSRLPWLTALDYTGRAGHDEEMRRSTAYRRAMRRDPQVMGAIAERLGADPCLTVADVRSAFTAAGVELEPGEDHLVVDTFDEIRIPLVARFTADLAIQRAERTRDRWTGTRRQHAAWRKARWIGGAL
ncbi:zinc-binding metallopeptidase family protein [Parafrankia discariae]|uniref:hypothetical protein n=1 Tax=Parafrankia discariae TaxID=365528 RepID=UPI00039E6D33|nr:hypothetical protein [Parafrankia discariae]